MATTVCSTAFGVDPVDADSAREEQVCVLQEKRTDLFENTFDRPFWPVAHTIKTKEIADHYAKVLLQIMHQLFVANNT